MEANLAGSPPLPQGVHAIIANFDQLFGTETGLELQQWCANSSWVLLWALDPTGGADHHAPGLSFKDPSVRMVDPTVLPHLVQLMLTLAINDALRFPKWRAPQACSGWAR